MNAQDKRGATRDTVYDYAANNFGTVPEHLWKPFPLYLVFRRADNKKWYAIIMDIPKNKLGLDGDERVDVLDVKCSPAAQDALLKTPGFVPAYHMSRKNWISVLLDGTVDSELVCELVADSYVIASGKAQKVRRTRNTSVLVPANPKYFDIVKAFSESADGTILWKQSSNVIVGDTVYLYVAAPLSCIMYKCEAVEVDIPYDYADENVSMSRVMKIKLLYTYGENEFGIDRLKKRGIASVRGPRSIPYSLRIELEEAADGT
ncbi:MAG: MmcQ/YjbR family DNA-binding protein [Clostridiales bacterium]|nr:MmcQ/YjbR family DNA-binding protein [Clostridiales bacterium]